MKIVVLGAGVIGTTTAYYLARDGHNVAVVERRDDVAQETSFANGGIIHISLVDPWNAPGIALKLVRWLGRRDSPALLRASALPGMLRWGLAFLRNSSRTRHWHHTLVNLRLALYSAQALKELRAETAIAYDQSLLGLLKVFREQESLAAAIAFARQLTPHGVAHRVLSPSEAVALEPALAPVGDRIVGAVHFPDDESGDAFRFTRGLAEAAGGLGADFRFGVTIERLETDGDRIAAVMTTAGRLTADAFVLACGSYSAGVARSAGLRLPIYPVKGYSFTIPLDGWNDAPRAPVVDETLKVGLVPLGNHLRIAGSAEFTGYDSEPSPRRSDYVWRTATRIYPQLARCTERASLRAWCGLRPMTPDGPPILGPARYRNLFLNTGHGHLGWTLACGSAKALAGIIAGRPGIDLDGLTLARYGRS